MPRLNENLAHFRKKNGLNQNQVATYLGVSRATYTKYEGNGIEPSITSLIKLADLYKVSLDILVGRQFISQDLNEKNLSPFQKNLEKNELKLAIRETVNQLIEENENKIIEKVIHKLGDGKF